MRNVPNGTLSYPAKSVQIAAETARGQPALPTSLPIMNLSAKKNKLLVASVILALAGSVSASTYVVDRSDDADVRACTDATPLDCTLRGAINAANAHAGADTINFAIASGVQTIAVGAGGLPAIIEAVTIDGTTQPGFTVTPLIELNGAGAGVNTDGIKIGNSGDGTDGSGTTIRGLVINRFDGQGIVAGDEFNFVLSNNITIQGCFIGTDVNGTHALSNGSDGIRIEGGFSIIGGTATGARNLISGNGSSGVHMANRQFGASQVQGNFIGTDITGTIGLPNAATGLLIEGDDNLVGGNVADAGNIIAFNLVNGVTISSGVGNQVFGNSISNNGGLGIDLAPDGVTPNDQGDADGGANHGQNFPVIESAVSSGGTTTVQGTLNSVPNGIFFIDLYSSTEADPTGFGEGQNYLGAVRVVSDERSASFSFTAGRDLAGQFITATATNSSTGDTSEFNAALLATAAPTPTPSPTPTPTPTVTPVPTITPTPTVTPSPSPTPTPAAQPLNISTRLRVQTGDNVLIGGFIIHGETPKRIIVRALGPSLSSAGLSGVLADPVIELHGPGGEVIAQNDNWRDTQAAEIVATGLAPKHDSEAAIVTTLPPAGYTVIVRGTSESTGVALVEAYDLDPATSAQLSNISTRGFVETGDGVLIGGFILGGTTSEGTPVVLRGLGKSLAHADLSNVLANPTLDLRDANGTQIAFNDDWMDNPAQAVQLKARGLAPSDPSEAGIFTILAPGKYTVILAGQDGTTGLGLVEIYKTDN